MSKKTSNPIKKTSEKIADKMYASAIDSVTNDANIIQLIKAGRISKDTFAKIKKDVRKKIYNKFKCESYEELKKKRTNSDGIKPINVYNAYSKQCSRLSATMGWTKLVEKNPSMATKPKGKIDQIETLLEEVTDKDFKLSVSINQQANISALIIAFQKKMKDALTS